jgi:hypothetical protein
MPSWPSITAMYRQKNCYSLVSISKVNAFKQLCLVYLLHPSTCDQKCSTQDHVFLSMLLFPHEWHGKTFLLFLKTFSLSNSSRSVWWWMTEASKRVHIKYGMNIYVRCKNKLTALSPWFSPKNFSTQGCIGFFSLKHTHFFSRSTSLISAKLRKNTSDSISWSGSKICRWKMSDFIWYSCDIICDMIHVWFWPEWRRICPQGSQNIVL